MQQSPLWEANSKSYNPVIPCTLWNLKISYHVHDMSHIPHQSQINLTHTLQYTAFPTHLKSSHLYLRLPIGILPSGFPIKPLHAFVFPLGRCMCVFG
jgi:hypothetical protein